MTSLDPASFTVSALGRQAASQRETAPANKISTVGRHHYEKVFISEEHTKVAKIGRESPLEGPKYNLKSSLSTRTCSFGVAKRDITTLKKTSTSRNKPGEFMPPQNDDPDNRPTNDALDVIPDSQTYKYGRDPTIIMGTEARGRLNDAQMLVNHAAAFYARESPGPASVGGPGGPDFNVGKPSLAPARTFGAKTVHKGTDWMRCGDNPEDVGPGRHDRKDVSLGPQYLTKRRNQTVNVFPKAERLKATKSESTISKLDAAKSSMGKQALNRNRSEPSINFNADDRSTRAKTMLCMTKQDRGPTASLPKFVARQPPLPMEKHVMRGGFG